MSTKRQTVSKAPKMLTVNGQTRPLTAWLLEAKCSRAALIKRLALGWTPERAVYTPIDISCHHHTSPEKVRRGKNRRRGNAPPNLDKLAPHLAAQIVTNRTLNPEALKAVRGLAAKADFTEAYVILYEYGPMTGQELNARRALTEESVAGEKRVTYCKLHAALAPLQKLGLVKVIGRRTCAVAGGTCQVFDVTDTVPATPIKWSAGRVEGPTLPARRSSDRHVPEPAQLRAAITDFKRMMRIVKRMGQYIVPFCEDALKFLAQEADRYETLPTNAVVLQLVGND